MQIRRITHGVSYTLIAGGIGIQNDGQQMLTEGWSGLWVTMMFAVVMAAINLGLALSELLDRDTL